MSIWRQFKYGLKHLFLADAWRRDVLDEIDQYIGDATEAWQEVGMSSEDARRIAINQFGDAKEALKEIESYGWESRLTQVFSDGRIAMHHLYRYRALSIFALLALACGIGVNIAVASFANGLLYRHIAALDGTAVVRLKTAWPSINGSTNRVTALDMADVRKSILAFSDVSLFQAGNSAVQIQEQANYIQVSRVDAKFVDIFKVQPISGRMFRESEAHRAVVVAQEFAKAHFDSEAGSIGKTMFVDGDRVTVVGVLPRGFNFPEGTQVWEAAPTYPETLSRTAFNYQAIARLRGNDDFDQARRALSIMSKEMQHQDMDADHGKEIVAEVLAATISKSGRLAVLLIWSLGFVLFLIALLNALGFHLTCARDWVVFAISADRRDFPLSRIRRFLIIEVLIMSILSGALGIVLSGSILPSAVWLARSSFFPDIGTISLGSRSIILAVISVSVAVIAASWISVQRVQRALRAKPIAEESREHQSGSSFKLNYLLLTAAFIMLCGAGVLMHEVRALQTTKLGFEKSDVIVMNTASQEYRSSSSKTIVGQTSKLIADISSIPKIDTAAGIMGLPMSEYGSNGSYDTRASSSDVAIPGGHANFSVVTPNYFHTMRIPITSGRDFSSDDDSDGRSLAIVSDSLAMHSFGSLNVLGRQIRCGLDSDQWMTIVAVVGDVKQDYPSEAFRPALYVPLAQHTAYVGQLSLVIRTKSQDPGLQSEARSVVSKVDPTLAVRFVSMSSLVKRAIGSECFSAEGASLLAALAIIFALLRLYQTHPIFERRNQPTKLRLENGHSVSTETVKALATSIGSGIMLLTIISPFVQSSLQLVRPFDPISVIGAAVLLTIGVLVVRWRLGEAQPAELGRISAWSP